MLFLSIVVLICIVLLCIWCGFLCGLLRFMFMFRLIISCWCGLLIVWWNGFFMVCSDGLVFLVRLLVGFVSGSVGYFCGVVCVCCYLWCDFEWYVYLVCGGGL